VNQFEFSTIFAINFIIAFTITNKLKISCKIDNNLKLCLRYYNYLALAKDHKKEI
jgi:hypothetical protein